MLHGEFICWKCEFCVAKAQFVLKTPVKQKWIPQIHPVKLWLSSYITNKLIKKNSFNTKYSREFYTSCLKAVNVTTRRWSTTGRLLWRETNTLLQPQQDGGVWVGVVSCGGQIRAALELAEVFHYRAALRTSGSPVQWYQWWVNWWLWEGHTGMWKVTWSGRTRPAVLNWVTAAHDCGHVIT